MSPLRPEDNLIGRYHGPTRVTCIGDPAICARFIAVGRNLLAGVRFSLAQGGITFGARTVQLGPVQIRVSCMESINEIEIVAPGGGVEEFEERSGYQFAVTGLPHRVVLPGSPNLTLADMVYVPWPDPRKKQRWEDVKPVPTGAMLREDEDIDPRWPFFPVNTAADYAVAANLGWRKNIGLQVDGAPPTEHSRYRPSGEDPPQYNASRPIYTSVASNEGQIRMAGAFMPAYGFTVGDTRYDRAPQTPGMAGSSGSVTLDGKMWSRSRAGYQAPDADWYHDATVISVLIPDTTQTIPFVVMVDASSTFYAWPAGTAVQPELADGLYSDQSIKTNIPPERAVMCKPPFPGWVYDTTSFSYREFYASEGHQPFWPRYVWRFHPFENKVVGMCLQRTEPNYTVLKSDAVFPLNSFIPNTSLSPASIYAKRKVIDDKTDTTLYPMMEDIPGFAEFEFSITIDPMTPFDVQTCTFEFSMSLTRDEVAAEYSYPIAAAYLNPVQGTWDERGVSAVPGELIVAYLRLYEHPKYRKDSIGVLMTGIPSFVQHQFSRAYMDIKNRETGTLLKSVPLMINDDFYELAYTRHLGTEASATTMTETLGRIEQLQLEEFSWLVRYEKTRIQPIKGSSFTIQPSPVFPELPTGLSSYSTVESDTGIVFGAESQIGIRFIHRNTVRKEEVYGVNLEVFSTVDDETVTGTPLLLETQRLLLYPDYDVWSGSNKLYELWMYAIADGWSVEGLEGVFTAPRFESQHLPRMRTAFGEDWDENWVEDIIKPYLRSMDQSRTFYRREIKRDIMTWPIPGDFYFTVPGYSAGWPSLGQKNRIEKFNSGINSYLRAWQFMVGESFRQYFHTGPDGSYAIHLAIPHINSIEPATDPVTGQVIGVPEEPKPYPVGVGFHKWGWVNAYAYGEFEAMSDVGLLYEMVDELEKHEPDMGRPFTDFTERTLTVAFMDEVGFERGGHPVTSHLKLYQRAYGLSDVEIDVTKFYAQCRIVVREYVGPNAMLGIDSVLYTKDVTPSGSFLDERYRVSMPPSLSNIPGLRLYEGNNYDLDTPRFNAGMHGVGFYLTGWHEYPE